MVLFRPRDLAIKFLRVDGAMAFETGGGSGFGRRADVDNTAGESER